MLMIKVIYILIGPKGAGKSYIGSLMEKQFGIKFIRVEDIWLKLKNEKKYSSEKEYFDNINSFYSEAIIFVKEKLKTELISSNSIVFESLGITPHFDTFILELKQIAKVVLIKINSDPKICLSRIKMRNQSIHIPISDEIINEINSHVANNKLVCDFEINNLNLSDQDIVDILKSRIKLS
jgi:shikimate kinase